MKKETRGRNPKDLVYRKVGFDRFNFKAIEDYAKENCEGNFSMAIRMLLNKQLKES